MRRALFLLELRRALVPSLSVGVTLTLILTVIEKTLVIGRGENPSTAWGAVHMVILGGIAISGLFVGARVFSEEFKRQHHPLLAVLPLPAGEGWLVLLAAGLSSSILAVAVVVLLRPALAADRESLVFLGVASLGHVYLYLIGACLTLTLRRGLFVPLLGFPLAALVLFETLSVDPNSPLARTLLASFGAVASMLFFALAGWRIYVRGEFELRKTRVTHLSLILGGAMLLVLGVRVVHPTPLLIQRWPVAQRPRVSASARHIALCSIGLTGRHTIYFASVETGGPTGQWTAVHLDAAGWAPDEDVLWVATTDEPLLRVKNQLSTPAAVLTMIETDGTVRSRSTLPGSELFAFEPLPGRRALAIVGDASASKIAVVEADGAVRVLEGNGIPGAGRLSRASDGRLVAILGTRRLARGFLYDGDGLHRLETAPLSGEGPPGFTVIGRRLFGSSAQALPELEQLYPRPPGSRRGEYIYDRVLCDEATTVFFRTPATERTARLEVWDPSSHSWKDVAQGHLDDWSDTLTRNEFGNATDLHLEFLSSSLAALAAPPDGGSRIGSVVDPRRGLAAYVAPSGSRFDVSVFDAKLGRSVALARLEQSPSAVGTAAAGAHEMMVAYRIPGQKMFASFIYTAGTAAVVERPALRAGGWWSLLAIRPDGSSLLEIGDGASRRDRDGVDHPIRFH